jgi:plasmid replication initiation protein
MSNKILVKEPEEMIFMRGGEFSESALKLSAYLIANLKENQNIYEINIKEYLKKFDKKIKDYSYLKGVAEELSKKQFKMEDRFKKSFEIYNFIGAIKYDEGILKVEFSTMLMEYLLKIKDKYLKYDIKNIMSLNSKYSIRLYKILKDRFEQESKYNKRAELKISLDKLREVFEIPKSYLYANSSGIKARMIEKAKKEFAEHTDIIFEYEEIKTGRKVTHLKFYILPNPAKLQDNYNKNDKIFKTRASFVKFLRDNYLGNGKFFGYKTFEDGNYWLGINNKGLMYATGNEIRHLNSVESGEIYDIWFKIAQNSELYQELILSKVCLQELQKLNKDKFMEFNYEIKLLKEQGNISHHTNLNKSLNCSSCKS